jgi:DNA-binding response OmpR family regulator
MNKPLALVVEDEYDVSIIFAKALQAAGFDTKIMRSGDTALTWLASMTPDIVILDLNLPRVPGTEILHAIRTDARLSNTKVIVATAYPRLAESLQDDADWILAKPVSFGQLRDLAAHLASNAALGKKAGADAQRPYRQQALTRTKTERGKSL